MKLLKASFMYPVRVPGQPGDRHYALATTSLTLTLEGAWVRMADKGDVVFVPLTNVVSFQAEPAEAAPKAKRSSK